MPGRVQDFIPIDKIRDGVVILKTGELRSILLVSSINFELKSHDEQLAILAGYQNFLNSLDFSVQMFVQSRKLDIRPYMSMLESREREQTNDLIKIQTREYSEFIKSVTEQTNVMSKTFFVVIPYSPFSVRRSGGPLSSLFGRGKKKDAKKEAEKFQSDKSQLDQRRTIVMRGLSRIGVRAMPLGTEEIVELFYKMFNPGDINLPPVPESQTQVN